MIEDINHHYQVKILVGKGQFLNRMVVEHAAGVLVDLPYKGHREVNVRTNERIGKEEMRRFAYMPDEPHVCVQPTAYFNCVFNGGGQKSITFKRLHPPAIAIITSTTIDKI